MTKLDGWSRESLPPMAPESVPEAIVSEAVVLEQRARFFRPRAQGTVAAVYAALEGAQREGVDGDYLEFGVYRGYTFWFAQQAADYLGLDKMRFFGFDSFEGLPPVVGPDADDGRFRRGDFFCTREQVQAYLDRYGVDPRRTHLVAGFFDSIDLSTLPATDDPRRASVVLIDCDLYASTVDALALVAPLLQDGTRLLFDDWDLFGGDDHRGERRALREFLAEHPEWTVEPLGGFAQIGMGFRLGTISGQ